MPLGHLSFPRSVGLLYIPVLIFSSVRLLGDLQELSRYPLLLLILLKDGVLPVGLHVEQHGHILPFSVKHLLKDFLGELAV